jgi:hypothetical protein
MRKFLLMPVAIGVVAVFGGSVARTAPATTIASDAIPNSASVAASGRVTAHLTKTSFTAAQAESVKLVYAFSPASARFGYLLSLKKGANWMKVRSVSKTGSFKGSYTMTVKKLFGSKAVKIGQYRVKVSADANSVTRSFKVVKAAPNGGSTPAPAPGAFGKTSPANGATGQPVPTPLSWGASGNAASYEYCIDTTNNNACDGSWVSTSAATNASLSGLTLGATYYWQVHAKNAQGTTDADGGSWFSFTVSGPLAGFWTATIGVYFYVMPDQANVIHVDFSYHFDNGLCSGNGEVWTTTPKPIVNGQFSNSGTTTWSGTGGGVADFSGTFDSPTSAHGTAQLTGQCWIPWENPPFSWTATWQDASQPS